MTNEIKLRAIEEVRQAYRNTIIATEKKLDKESINCYAIQYRALRSFSIGIGLLSFNDLEIIEHETKEQIETTITEEELIESVKEYNHESTKLAEKAIARLQEAIESKNAQSVITAYNMIEEEDSFKWDDIKESYFQTWDKLVTQGNELIFG